MVVVNLYPFAQIIAQENVTAENARGNIDIGGPTMIRAAAKNFIRVASVVDPNSYDDIVASLKKQGGALGLKDRYALASKAFEHTAQYDRAIADYMAGLSNKDVQSCYKTGE
jgi:phosphoribosylaminoimidazolecarboxamide formyltransferase/IMP cyclohydrolase